MSNSILDKELKKRAIPDVLTLPNGEKVTTKEQWEKELRPYWLKTLLREEYGRIPPSVKPTIETKVNFVDFAGKAVWETVTFTFEYNDGLIYFNL